MQPLSHVRSNATSHWGDQNTISSRPKIAIKIAECIAEWAEIETVLGMFLGFLLHTSSKAALAMYAALENRAAQFRMLDAATKSELPSSHYDVISVLHTIYIRPAMRDRDRLAHWCWGHSPDLPNDLLISQPSDKTLGTFRANQLGKGTQLALPSDHSTIFVITEDDITRMLERFRKTKLLTLYAAGSVWTENTPQERAEHLQTLSNEPEIQKGLIRLNEARQKNRASQPLSPRPEPNSPA